jgi:hypothetical protein
MWIIGDIHNHQKDYFKLIKTLEMDCSIQVGDLGFGFPNCKWPQEWDMAHRWFPGNHDARIESKNNRNCLGDFGFLEKQNIFFLSGAWSIDRGWRQEGVDWWADEELTPLQFNQGYRDYVYYTPRIMLSHDCPSSIRKEIFNFDRYIETRTGKELDHFFNTHQPELWIFGHYHKKAQKVINGTRFICLQELECCEIPDIKW